MVHLYSMASTSIIIIMMSPQTIDVINGRLITYREDHGENHKREKEKNKIVSWLLYETAWQNKIWNAHVQRYRDHVCHRAFHLCYVKSISKKIYQQFWNEVSVLSLLFSRQNIQFYFINYKWYSDYILLNLTFFCLTLTVQKFVNFSTDFFY